MSNSFRVPPETLKKYLVMNPEFCEPVLPAERFLKLFSFGEMTGEWWDSGWSTIAIYRDLELRSSARNESGNSAILLEEQVFVRKLACNLNDTTLTATIIWEKPIPAAPVENFLNDLLGTRLSVLYVPQDMLFDGGAFALSVDYRGTEITVAASDPPPGQELQTMLRKCQLFVRELEQ